MDNDFAQVLIDELRIMNEWLSKINQNLTTTVVETIEYEKVPTIVGTPESIGKKIEKADSKTDLGKFKSQWDMDFYTDIETKMGNPDFKWTDARTKHYNRIKKYLGEA